jgi:hypothetical protein
MKPETKTATVTKRAWSISSTPMVRKAPSFDFIQELSGQVSDSGCRTSLQYVNEPTAQKRYRRERRRVVRAAL